MDYHSALNVLELQSGATEQEIKSQFRKKAAKMHPDVNKEDGAEQKYKELSEAFEYLKVNNFKAKPKAAPFNRTYTYSETDFGHVRSYTNPFRGAPFDFFVNFTSNGRPNVRQNIPAAPQHIEKSIGLTFKEWIIGHKVNIDLNLQVVCENCKGEGKIASPETTPCKHCQGQGKFDSYFMCGQCDGTGQEKHYGACLNCNSTGEVKKDISVSVQIPPCMPAHAKLRVPGKGNFKNISATRYSQGDLFISINIEPHSTMKLVGNDIVTEYEISLLDAINGKEITVESVFEDKKAQIPKLSKNLDQIVLSNNISKIIKNHILILKVNYPEEEKVNKIIEILQENDIENCN